MYNSLIRGVVNRDSSDRRIPPKPLRCAGLYKTEGACVSSPEVATKPSPYTLGAFCLEITNTPQSGLANGPEWAALKKHRRRCPSAFEPPVFEGLANCMRQSGETTACRKVNRSLLGNLDSCNTFQELGSGLIGITPFTLC